MNKKLLSVIGGSVLSAMLLTGCGNDDDTNNPPPEDDTIQEENNNDMNNTDDDLNTDKNDNEVVPDVNEGVDDNGGMNGTTGNDDVLDKDDDKK